ncbi:hypothetical protein KSS87_001362 [Heliosperma pusillum]|nr:hypothetical protein KSS87_001362 [Heliosperma pusillum]
MQNLLKFRSRLAYGNNIVRTGAILIITQSDSQDLLNAMGSMYAACLFLGVENASSIRPVIGVERTVFYREKAAGLYSALPYALAQVQISYFSRFSYRYQSLIHRANEDRL